MSDSCEKCHGRGWIWESILGRQTNTCPDCGGIRSIDPQPKEPPACSKCGDQGVIIHSERGNMQQFSFCDCGCYQPPKEKPVCSDKQVIEDAVKEAKADADKHAITLGVNDKSFDAGWVQYHWGGWTCCGENAGKHLPAISRIKTQMTRAAKRRKKLADKLRPKVLKPFLIDERSRFPWPLWLLPVAGVLAMAYGMYIATQEGSLHWSSHSAAMCRPVEPTK